MVRPSIAVWVPGAKTASVALAVLVVMAVVILVVRGYGDIMTKRAQVVICPRTDKNGTQGKTEGQRGGGKGPGTVLKRIIIRGASVDCVIVAWQPPERVTGPLTAISVKRPLQVVFRHIDKGFPLGL